MSDGIDKNDNIELPSVESQASPYDVPQNNNVLPRNIFTSGVLPGNSVIQIGDKNLIIDGKNNNFIVSDGVTIRVCIGKDKNGNWGIFIYDNSGNLIFSSSSGYVIGAGTITGTMIANATITAANIANATITNAQINDLSASKLTAGTIDASSITVSNLNASNINTGTLNGVPVQTGSSGARVIMNVSSQSLDFHSSNALAGTIKAYIASSPPLLVGSSYMEFTSDQNLFDGDVTIIGNIDTWGTKNFKIPHPTKPNKNLVYACPESPEVLLQCRGKIGDKIPQHFIDMTEPGTLQTITGVEGNWLVSGIRKGYKDFECEPDSVKYDILK